MTTTACRALPYPLPEPDEPVTLADVRDTALPLLRSAHCTLRALSLAAARDTVVVEDLPAALDVLAGQIEACRDLIDHATHDR